MFLFILNGLDNSNKDITNTLLVKKISPLINDYVNSGVKENNELENKYANNRLTALTDEFKVNPFQFSKLFSETTS